MSFHRKVSKERKQNKKKLKDNLLNQNKIIWSKVFGSVDKYSAD